MRCNRPLIPGCLVAVAAASSLLAAGCGGGGSPGVASVHAAHTPAAMPTPTGALAYARCMRSHGEPGFPDPESNGEFAWYSLKSLHGGKLQLRASDEACRHLLPNGLRVTTPRQAALQTRSRVADELSFARCMRSQGLTRFPDPPARGDLTVAMVQAHGIDVYSPAVLQVVHTCLPASHGWLTAAKVREALSARSRTPHRDTSRTAGQ
jgi:hypothetical protein